MASLFDLRALPSCSGIHRTAQRNRYPRALSALFFVKPLLHSDTASPGLCQAPLSSCGLPSAGPSWGLRTCPWCTASSGTRLLAAKRSSSSPQRVAGQAPARARGSPRATFSWHRRAFSPCSKEKPGAAKPASGACQARGGAVRGGPRPPSAASPQPGEVQARLVSEGHCTRLTVPVRGAQQERVRSSRRR